MANGNYTKIITIVDNFLLNMAREHQQQNPLTLHELGKNDLNCQR